jgi:hypothetical protein
MRTTDSIPNMRHTVLAIPDGIGDLRHIAGAPLTEKFPPIWTGRSLLGVPGGEDGLRREVVWSGSFAELDGGGAFDDDPRTWGPKGWEALRARVEAEIKDSVAIRPHARHVVSDIPGCRRLIQSEWGIQRGISLCYDPASMMTLAMMDRAEDHLRRMYEALELIPAERLAMVVVSGVDAASAACGVDKCGELGCTVARLAAACVPEGVAIAVLEERVGEQVQMLREAGA